MARARRGRGEGSIYFDKEKGLFVTAVSLGYNIQGRRVRRKVYGKTKGEVKTKLLELQQDLAKGLPAEPNKMTVRQLFTDWLAHKKADVESATHANYARLYRVHIEPTLGGVKLQGLGERHVSAFVLSLDERVEAGEASTRTRAYILWLLRTVLDDAVERHIIPSNPARAKRFRRGFKPRPAAYMDREDMRVFLSAASGHRLGDLFTLMLFTGLRPGEAFGLAWSNVDLRTGKLHVRQALHEEDGKVFLGRLKTDAAKRTITLPQAAAEALKRQKVRQKKERLQAGGRWSNEADLCFTDQLGGFLRRTNVQRRDLRRIIQDAREQELARQLSEGASMTEATRRAEALLMGVHLHSFRHTHASLLIASGADAKVVQHRLGHEDVRITLQTYAHLFEGQDAGAAERVDAFVAELT